ncbi:MAG: ATP-binding protein [Bacteroidales bacterium]
MRTSNHTCNSKLLLLFFLVILFSLSGLSQNQNKTILFVGSFSAENSWTKTIKSSMLKKFKNEGYKINLKEIYLDDKKIKSKDERIEFFLKHFYRLKDSIDLIVAVDYSATDVILTYSDSVLEKYPIVFVSELEQNREIPFKNITGAISDYAISRTYKTSLKVFPDTETIYVWADKSQTGEFFINEAKKILNIYSIPDVKIEYGVDADSKEELLEKFSAIGPKSVIIFGTWQISNKGEVFNPNELYAEICKATDAPILTVFDGFIGSGIVGGFVQSPENNGEILADKAIRIFSGELPKHIQIENLPPIPIFDYDKTLSKGGLLRLLPANSVKINQFKAFFRAHRVLLSLIGFILFSIIIAFILRSKNKTLKTHIKAREKYEKKLQMNIKLLSFAMPSLQILFWSYNQKTKKFRVGTAGETDEMDLSETFDSNMILESIAPEFRAEMLNFLEELLVSENGYEFAWEYKGKTRSKDDFTWWETRGTVELIRENGNEYRLIHGINFNVDKYKNIEERLNKALEKSIQSDNLKSKFIANISHEIRTPLNAIMGFSDLIIDSQDKDEQLEYKKIIRENNDLLLNLVNDIIELSEIESGFIEMKRIRFDLKQFFDEMESLMKYKFNDNIQFIIDSPHKSCIVLLDKVRLSQIFKELINNALKFTTNGFIKIGYEVLDSKRIKFYIQDTGIGIKQENIPKIYDRFEKFDSYKSGTGLGLPIIKAILEAVNAEFSIESIEGEGTVFWTILKTDYLKIDDSQEMDENIEIKNYSSKKIKVLVVDNTACSNKLMHEVLKQRYDINCIKLGMEAIDEVSKNQYDIALVSIDLEDIDGYKVIETIREMGIEIPIIAVSTRVLSTEKEKAFKAGCDDFIEKPFEKEFLIMKIDNHTIYKR